jgi:predicted acylesterase/phospholipase RssA
MAIRRLVIGPGAMAYFGFLGALSALKDKGALNELEAVSGSSAGGILGFMYILAKGDTKRIFDFSLKVPIKKLMKPNIKTLLKSFGLVSTKKLYNYFQETVSEFIPGQSDITFKELYDHWNIKLYIPSCCLNLYTTHYFSVDHSPDMSVLRAICMTIAVPFLIESVEYNNLRYIDGSVLETTPCSPFIGQENVQVVCVDDWSLETIVPDLKTYAVGIINSAMGLRHKYPQFPSMMVSVPADIMFDFGSSTESKVKLFTSGYMSARIS